MKKIIKIILIGIMFFCYSRTVSASTVTWKQITDKWKAMPEDKLDAIVTSDDSNLKIKDKNSDYEMNFTYNNGVISMIKPDISSLTEEQQTLAGFANITFLGYMLDIIGELNDVDLTKIETGEIEDYGIMIQTADIDTETVSFDFIDAFSINLDTFEEATQNLRGTYNANDNANDVANVIEPAVSLSLANAYTNSLNLVVNVTDLPTLISAKCDIYMIPDENTAFATGESHIVGTIDDCKNGNNTINIPNLKTNSKYTFQVVMTEYLPLNLTNQVTADRYDTFSTTSGGNDNNGGNQTKTNNVLTNPQTGITAFYIAISASIISAAGFIVVYLTERKKQKVN